MHKIINLFRCRRAMQKDGVIVESQYVLHLNNDEPKYFISKAELLNFLSKYQQQNQIFNIHAFRVDCYSLM